MSAPSAPAAAAPTISLNEAQQQTYDLITRNLQEVLGEDIIKSKLAKDEVVSCYWGEGLTMSLKVFHLGLTNEVVACRNRYDRST